jgi:hypothetical protein
MQPDSFGTWVNEARALLFARRQGCGLCRRRKRGSGVGGCHGAGLAVTLGVLLPYRVICGGCVRLKGGLGLNSCLGVPGEAAACSCS